jgi:hypothetical protein
MFLKAKVKFAKAEKALAKVQEALAPKELPTDLETVTVEERAKFRSIGLKIKSFPSLGVLSVNSPFVFLFSI